MMSCKILLISANRHKEPYPVYPLGVSYLKTYIKNHFRGDCEVEVFDCNLGSDEDLIEKIRDFDPNYIGVSLRNVDGANSLDRRGFIGEYRYLIDVIKFSTHAKIIVGGAGFSIFPDKVMDEIGADYGVRGEGEAPMLELIQTLEQGGDVRQIEAIVTPGTVCGKPGDRHYLRELEVEFEPYLVEYYWKHSGMLNIQTKRGCPYNCIYCSYPVIDGRRVRTLDAETVVDNILRLKRDFGVNYLFFTDSVFNICNEYNITFAEKLIESGADVSWGAYFSPSNLTAEQIELYRRSGLTHVEFGTESLSDNTLRAYKKHFTFDDILHASQLCLNYNVYYSHFLILGGYGETEQSLAETIERSKQLRHTVIFPYIGMRIYPHTELREVAVREGVITADDTLVEPKYYVAPWLNLEDVRRSALATGKAWVFPDDPQSEMMETLRLKRNKKGPIWEYLRKP